MAAAQRKIGSIVIERRPIQPHDVCIAALVFGVTVFAEKLRLIFGDAAVEARQRRHVGTDFLVTIHTQRRLFGCDERSVAIRTIVFEVGMTFDHRAGHDQSLETRGKRQTRHEQRQYQHDACAEMQSHDQYI
jgi:hypothetical protein